MANETLVGIDLGTSSCKAVALDLHGSVLAEGRARLAAALPTSGQAEQSADAWRQAFTGAVHQLWDSGVRSEAVVGVGVCAHWPSLALLDVAGDPLRPALLWKDNRGSDWPDLSLQAIAERVGLPPAYVSSLPVAKLRWLQNHEPELFQGGQLRWCLGAKDSLVFWLTGQATTDQAEAWWSGLAGRSGTGWDAELLQRLALPDTALPMILPVTALAGVVSWTAASLTGLHAGTPVAVGTPDGVCGAIGAGLAQPGLGVVVHGSSLIVATPAPAGLSFGGNDAIIRFPPLVEPHDLLYTSTPSGSADLFIEGMIGHDRLCQLRAEAFRSASAPDDPLFIPHVEGITSPWLNLGMRGAWFNISLGQDWPALYRAVQEGIVFSARQIVGTLANLGAPLARVRLGGGGSKSNHLCRLYADALSCPVARLTSSELGCLGAAALASVAAGVYPDLPAAMADFVRETDVFEPAADRAVVERRYQRFAAACSWLATQFDDW
jgi:xylulokinase